MIIALLKAQWSSLVRDRVALFLQFLLPIIFFSVFALIFGGGSSGSSKPADTKVAVLDLDESSTSKAIGDALKDLGGVETFSAETLAEKGDASTQPTEDEVLRLVVNNTVDAAVIFPKGIEDSLANFGGERPSVKVYYDSANPMAQNMLSGVLQGAAFTAAPDILMEKGLDQFQNFGGAFTEQQKSAVVQMKQLLKANSAQETRDENAEPENSSNAGGFSMAEGLIKIETMSAQTPKMNSNRQGSMIAYYAASVAVMFLMFSMAGAASVLLEYQENGTLERLISGQMKISQLLLSHWLFFVLTGVLQLAIMFTYAVLVFKVDLSSGPVLLGTAVMTVVTSMASASFIMLMATLCRSRKQLESISTTVILIMSAFGGSMIPRPFLPEKVQATSKLTFNGWSLDGFLRVLWYYDPTQNVVSTIALHVVVILAMAAGFLLLAIWRARKWTFA